MSIFLHRPLILSWPLPVLWGPREHTRKTQVFSKALSPTAEISMPPSSMASTYLHPLGTPVRTLILCFTLWKVTLLLIAACSPGSGYDTSTSILLSSLHSIGNKKLPSTVRYLIGKLVRWDAFYFVRASNRGYLYEQEWAFGWGFTHLIKFSIIGEYRLWLQSLPPACTRRWPR